MTGTALRIACSPQRPIDGPRWSANLCIIFNQKRY
jgi:hypothetical protein